MYIGQLPTRGGFVDRPKMERDTPGKKAPMIEIPVNAKPGQAALVSSLRYGCNATHRLVPIEVTTVEMFTILPP